MLFRLTYALSHSDIYTIELKLTTGKEDMLGAYEEAIDYIEKEHGAEEVLNVIAISILLIKSEEKQDEEVSH